MKSVIPSASKHKVPQIDWKKVAEDYQEWFRLGTEETRIWENQMLKIRDLVEDQLKGQFVR
jgi:hypothetical protein